MEQENQELFICKFCGKACKNANSLRNHERLCKMNPTHQTLSQNCGFTKFNKNRKLGKLQNWNKGLTKETDERIRKSAEKLKQKIKNGDIILAWSGKHLSDAHRAKLKKCGGQKQNSGRGRHGWYKDIWCDSSWELAFVIYHLDNNLNIKRCEEKRKYIFNNKECCYYPDFITDNGIFEIKGVYDEKSKAKHKQNLDVKILFFDSIKFYLDYVITKYGKDFTQLYNTHYINRRLENKNNEHQILVDNAYKLGIIGTNGKIVANKTTLYVLYERKKIIEESGVDLTKRGYITKITKLTNLSRKQVIKVIKYFNMI